MLQRIKACWNFNGNLLKGLPSEINNLSVWQSNGKTFMIYNGAKFDRTITCNEQCHYRRVMSSGMLSPVDWCTVMDVSEVRSAFNFRVKKFNKMFHTVALRSVAELSNFRCSSWNDWRWRWRHYNPSEPSARQHGVTSQKLDSSAAPVWERQTSHNDVINYRRNFSSKFDFNYLENVYFPWRNLLFLFVTTCSKKRKIS